MDGMHDMGGRQGFGRVRHSPRAAWRPSNPRSKRAA